MEPELTEQILKFIEKKDSADTLDLATHFNVDHQRVIGALKSIEATGDLLTVVPFSNKSWELTSEGKHVAEHGSHEAAVFNAIPADGIAQADLMKVIRFWLMQSCCPQ